MNTKPKKQRRDAIYNRIAKMLTENTGRHFLDSGGAYGRNWERNQGRNFDKEPAFTFSAYSESDFEPSFNIYHYLTSVLSVTPDSEKLNRKLSKKLKSEGSDKYAIEIMQEFIKEHTSDDVVHTYSHEIVNTYNFDNILSQVIQYGLLETDNGNFMILQIHGGCDVRGGYTDPQVFELTGDEYDHIFLMTDFSATCDGPNGQTLRFFADGGYFKQSTQDEDGSGLTFEEATFFEDGQFYSKFTGNCVEWGNYLFGTESKPPIETLPAVVKYVQNNYATANSIEDLRTGALMQFEDVNETFLNSIVNKTINEIESHTLKMAL